MKRILFSVCAGLMLSLAANAQDEAQMEACLDTIPTFNVKAGLTEALLDEILTSASADKDPSYPALSLKQDNRSRSEVLKEDRESWEWGNYVIAMDGEGYYSSGKTASLKNKVSGEYILPRFTKRDIKKYLKPGLPAGTIFIEQSNLGYDRIKFLDSAKQGTPPELDGLLYIDAEQFYLPSWSKKKTARMDFAGLYRIEGKSLKPVVEIRHKSSDEYLYLLPVPAIGAVFYHTVQENGNTHRFPVQQIYSYDGRVLLKDVMNVFVSPDRETVWVLDKETLGNLKEFYANKWQFSEYEYKPYDKYFNPVNTFVGYDFLSPRNNGGFYYIVAGKGELYGALDEKGKLLIPFLYLLPMQVDEVIKAYSQVGFTPWLKKKVSQIMATKDEFEKQEHFEARRQDPALQKAFILEKLPNPQLEYMEQIYMRGYNINLGTYDSEREVFPVYVSPGSWNSFTLPVPIAEAQAFKAAFDTIKADAIKGATFTIRYDTIALEDITFALPDGRFYRAHKE